MASVSVIIPVYKVEKFIEKCARSLMEQSLKDVEFIFVDDCTPDDSIIILEKILLEYPGRKNSVKVIHHLRNLGLPSARNTGLAHASGDYIFHCDSDDWVEPDMLESMLNAGRMRDADIIYCDFYLTFGTNERRLTNPAFTDGEQLLRDGFLSGRAKYNVWNKLVKRELYDLNCITFPDGHPMGEDMTMIILASNAKNVVYVPKAFYHYIKINANAYSNTVSEKQLEDTQFNVDRVVSFLSIKYGERIIPDIMSFKLSIKLPFLISLDKNSYRTWHNWYPEANSYILKDSRSPLRIILLQWCASKKIFFMVWLYNVLVNKVIYGLFYR